MTKPGESSTGKKSGEGSSGEMSTVQDSTETMSTVKDSTEAMSTAKDSTDATNTVRYEYNGAMSTGNESSEATSTVAKSSGAMSTGNESTEATSTVAKSSGAMSTVNKNTETASDLTRRLDAMSILDTSTEEEILEERKPRNRKTKQFSVYVCNRHNSASTNSELDNANKHDRNDNKKGKHNDKDESDSDSDDDYTEEALNRYHRRLRHQLAHQRTRLALLEETQAQQSRTNPQQEIVPDHLLAGPPSDVSPELRRILARHLDDERRHLDHESWPEFIRRDLQEEDDEELYRGDRGSERHDHDTDVFDMSELSDDALEALGEQMGEGDLESTDEAQLVPLYPVGKLDYRECCVCLMTCDLYLRACCDGPVCDECILLYVTVQVEDEGLVKMGCPMVGCTDFIPRDEIMVLLKDSSTKEKFCRYLANANEEINVRTCPRCSSVMTVEKELVKRPDKMGVRVVCDACYLEWCFVCQAPFHEKLSCRAFRKGDRLLTQWAKENHLGQANARKCPKCKTFISRSGGCDHMTCNQCHTEFCYRCGGRFFSLRGVGDHYTRLSIFGCKYRFMANKPHTRKFVRGSLFAGKIVMLPIVAGLAVGACAVLAATSVIILPVFGGIRLHKWRKKKKTQRNSEQAKREWTARQQELYRRGDPYLERYHLMQHAGMDVSLYSHLPNFQYRTRRDGTSTRRDSADSLPDTSAASTATSDTEPPAEPTQHVASVHKSGSPVDCDLEEEEGEAEGGEGEEFADVDFEELEEEVLRACLGECLRGAERREQQDQDAAEFLDWLNRDGKCDTKVDAKSDVKVHGKSDVKVESENKSENEMPCGGKLEFKLVQIGKSSDKTIVGEKSVEVQKAKRSLYSEAKSEADPVEVADETNKDDIQSMEYEIGSDNDSVFDSNDSNDVHSKSVTIRDVAVTVTAAEEKLARKIKEAEVKQAKIEEIKKSKMDNKKTRSSPPPISPLSLITSSSPTIEREEITLYPQQKPAKKSESEDKCKVKSIVSQYSCLGGKSGREEAYDGGEKEREDKIEEKKEIEKKRVVGKLMIRSASYDVAIREGESPVNVRQMAKRFSQGTS